MPSTVTDRLNGLTTSVAIKAPCVVATTANITLSALQTIDGVALAAGDRVLVKDQTTASQNGIWNAGTGDWTRAIDFNGSLDVVTGTAVTVTSGTVNADTSWRVATTGSITFDTTSVTFEPALTSEATGLTFTQAGTGAVARTAQDKLRECVTPEDFGVVDDPNYIDPALRINQAAALQAWLTYAAANRLTPYCNKPIRAYSNATLTFDPGGVVGLQKIPDIRLSNLTVAFDVAGGSPGFVIGSTTKALDSALIELPNVRRRSSGGYQNWTGAPTTQCGAIVLINLRYCTVLLSDVRGFPVGFQHWSEGFGYTYNTCVGGLMQDCRFGEVGICTGASSYFNENSWTGGSVSYSSTAAAESTSLVAGVYFTVGTSGYRGSNNNRWRDRSFEMTSTTSHASITESVPVWFEGCGNDNSFTDCRVEVWRGPVMHVRGDVNSDTNALYGIANEFDAQVVLDIAGEGRKYVRQVAGAYGNLATYPQRKSGYKWHSGPLREKLFSGGGADAARTVAPFILREGVDATNYRQLSLANRGATNIYGQQWNNGGVFVMLDTSRVKDFEFTSETLDGFPGRWFFAGYDANMALLGATTTDAYATERNIKFDGATATTLYGGGYQTSSDVVKQLRVTVRDEVKYLLAGPASGTAAVVVNGFEITGFAADQEPDGTAAMTGALVFDPIYGGETKVASADPDAAGTHGIYGPGMVIGNIGAASGQPAGWICTAGVALGVPFAISTAFAVPGQVVISDTGTKAYYVKTPGTTSGAGTGPSGTVIGTDYTDGTVVFRYMGAKAAFAALANVP